MRTQTVTRLLPVLLAALAVLAFTAAASQAANVHKSHSTSSATPSSTPAGSSTGTGTKPPTTKPAVKATKTRIRVTGLFHVDSLPVTVTHRKVHVKISVWPYVKNQQITLKVGVNGHTVSTRHVWLTHGKGDSSFVQRGVSVPSQGKVWVTVSHAANSRMKSYTLKSWYRALSTKAPYGTSDKFVLLMQQRMLKLHMFIQKTGTFDDQTGWALDAYHRLVGRGTARTFDPTIVNDLLDGKGRFHIRFPKQGRHAEGDLTDQLLALATGSKVNWILPISSGKESTPTVLGSWQIYRRQPLYTSDGMYYSDFFTGGYAIHGYDPAPDYPASHGCMRLWDGDAIPVYNWLALGDWVDSYGNAPFYLGEGDL